MAYFFFDRALNRILRYGPNLVNRSVVGVLNLAGSIAPMIGIKDEGVTKKLVDTFMEARQARNKRLDTSYEGIKKKEADAETHA